jgi:hypothetical protein
MFTCINYWIKLIDYEQYPILKDRLSKWWNTKTPTKPNVWTISTFERYWKLHVIETMQQLRDCTEENNKKKIQILLTWQGMKPTNSHMYQSSPVDFNLDEHDRARHLITHSTAANGVLSLHNIVRRDVKRKWSRGGLTTEQIRGLTTEQTRRWQGRRASGAGKPGGAEGRRCGNRAGRSRSGAQKYHVLSGHLCSLTFLKSKLLILNLFSF